MNSQILLFPIVSCVLSKFIFLETNYFVLSMLHLIEVRKLLVLCCEISMKPTI